MIQKFLVTLNIFLFFQALSQEVHDKKVFELQNSGKKYSSDLILKSLTDADWCGMINPSEAYYITFDDGAVVKINSMVFLRNQMVFIPEGCVREIDLKDDAVYRINTDGYILRLVQSQDKKDIKN
ncbi:MAG: hypothetical protein RIT43_303 [Bacteroidota bacterium]|jgi:hypothetical protein